MPGLTATYAFDDRFDLLGSECDHRLRGGQEDAPAVPIETRVRANDPDSRSRSAELALALHADHHVRIAPGCGNPLQACHEGAEFHPASPACRARSRSGSSRTLFMAA
jgi:hypothetical protein